SGKRVLLVDANLRRPTLDAKFKVNSLLGFADVLKGKAASSDAIIPLAPGLSLMPAGQMPRTAADLISTRASAVLASLLGYGNFDCATQLDFDLVIVDAPPVLAASEAQELAGVADGVLLLTKAGETDAKEVTNAISVLSRARANVVGLVLNQVKSQDAADSHASYHLEMTGSYMLPRLNA
ncbi:MAG: CpsD/CapB family tyrosine-protein kinase, partial [Acidobacteria bacterium]|nr:CpsD/CapB family tyrosine-protein kinase [Acidobacteriota bacterium]